MSNYQAGGEELTPIQKKAWAKNTGVPEVESVEELVIAKNAAQSLIKYVGSDVKKQTVIKGQGDSSALTGLLQWRKGQPETALIHCIPCVTDQGFSSSGRTGLRRRQCHGNAQREIQQYNVMVRNEFSETK